MSKPISITVVPENWILDDEGDIILAVGPTGAHRITVSSKVLCLASDVFKAMTKPRFREGLSLRSPKNPTAEPVVIVLPDDDPLATLMLCQLLHFQIDMVESHPDAMKVLALAVVCDKYNCAGAIRYATEMWLNLLVGSADVSSLKQLLIATYLLDSAVMFASVTSKLLRDWTGSFKGLARELDNTSLPTVIYVALEEKRLKSLFDVERSLQEMFRDTKTGICDNVYHLSPTGAIGQCVTIFVQVGIWPISPTPSIAVTLKQLNAFKWTPFSKGCGNSRCPIDFGPKIKEIYDMLRQIGGLCLDCVHHDGHNPGECRVAHSKGVVNSENGAILNRRRH
ncbi:hypothetical protein LPUS_12201 [Lasallia pustulata]|uniref:BTB domain-containing protein n=1 Tax=Lasallia pustulata TaxID=136370 RepID=A0A1W5DE34_9LECA|nr:hypothetical protein LPUS_12201 [Lasallia pustulata]